MRTLAEKWMCWLLGGMRVYTPELRTEIKTIPGPQELLALSELILEVPSRHSRERRSRHVRLAMGTCIFGLLMLCLSTPTASASGTVEANNFDHYRLGVIPWQSPSKLANMFLPLASALEQGLSHPVQFVTAPSYQQFVDRLESRDYHIAYLNPLLYPRAREAGYRLVAKLAGEGMNGILVTREDQALESLSVLANNGRLRLALPSAEAYSAVVLGEYLSAKGLNLNDFEVEYFGSQDSALLAVHAGRADISGTCLPSLRSMPDSVRKHLRIVEQTPPQAAMMLIVRDDLPDHVTAALVAILEGLNTNEDGRQILRKLGFYEGFVAAGEAAELQHLP
ncbi:MAG: phosphate/phosphite/phosphonate ABC transporter substrate-binding protein [Chromatiales bacterium]|nr:phosphate/phosphite/phosphonate ABC transporter substrate-binding protein [Chromatiales bacterium]